MLKSLQTFILDVLDVIDKDGDSDKDAPPQAIRRQTVVEAPAPAAPAAPDPTTLPAAPKKLSKAEREGASAKVILQQVSRLEAKRKMVEARNLRDTICPGKVSGARPQQGGSGFRAALLQCRRAGHNRGRDRPFVEAPTCSSGQLIFTIETAVALFLIYLTTACATRFIAQVLSAEMRERLHDKDDEARDDIENAARCFLKEVLASKGRRTDVENNAFWAAAVALIPSGVLQDRKGRAVMRLLGVNYHVVKKLSDMRGRLEDGSLK